MDVREGGQRVGAGDSEKRQEQKGREMRERKRCTEEEGEVVG
jgi:hypothetical protein